MAGRLAPVNKIAIRSLDSFRLVDAARLQRTYVAERRSCKRVRHPLVVRCVGCGYPRCLDAYAFAIAILATL